MTINLIIVLDLIKKESKKGKKEEENMTLMCQGFKEKGGRERKKKERHVSQKGNRIK